MRKITLEQYLAGLTGGQMRALALKFWAEFGGQESGAATLERYRAGQIRLKLEEREQSSFVYKLYCLVGKLVYELSNLVDKFIEICYTIDIILRL